MSEENESRAAELREELIACIRSEAEKTRRTITLGFIWTCAFLLVVALPGIGLLLATVLFLVLTVVTVASLMGRSVGAARDYLTIRSLEQKLRPRDLNH